MDFDLRSLQHVRALAEHRSFTRAARALHITQPALTRSVQLVEARIGAKLFARARIGVELTDVGRIFLERAMELLTRAEDLGRQVSLFQGIGGEALVVGAGPYPTRLLMGEAIAGLLRAQPAARLRVATGQYVDLIAALRRRELDLVVAESSTVEGDPEFEVHRLRSYQGYAMAGSGHPLAGHRELSVADVLAHPLALSGRVPPRVLEPLLSMLPRPRGVVSAGTFPAVECGDLGVLAEIAVKSEAVVLLPLTLAQNELASGRLVILPVHLPWAVTRFAIIRLKGRLLPALAEVLVREMVLADDAVHAADERLGAELNLPGPPLRPAGTARATSASPPPAGPRGRAAR
jgi:DNA-binding transcriptional LysR family regulator